MEKYVKLVQEEPYGTLRLDTYVKNQYGSETVIGSCISIEAVNNNTPTINNLKNNIDLNGTNINVIESSLLSLEIKVNELLLENEYLRLIISGVTTDKEIRNLKTLKSSNNTLYTEIYNDLTTKYNNL